jgi:hypothetical protein
MINLKLLHIITLVLLTLLLLFQGTAYSTLYEARTSPENHEKSTVLKEELTFEEKKAQLARILYPKYQRIKINMNLEDVQKIMGSPGIETQVTKEENKITTDYEWQFEQGALGVTIGEYVGEDREKNKGENGVWQKYWCCSPNL